MPPNFTIPTEPVIKKKKFQDTTLGRVFGFGRDLFNKLAPASKFLPPTIPGVSTLQGFDTARRLQEAGQGGQQFAPPLPADTRTSTPQFFLPQQQTPQLTGPTIQPPTPQAPFTPPVTPQMIAPTGGFDPSQDIERSRQFAQQQAQAVSPAAPEIPTTPEVPTPEAPPPAPPLPPLPSAAQEAVSVAEKALQQSALISPEELSSQADLDRLIESTKKGFTKIRGQAIPLEALVGQLELVEQRALDLAEPLGSKLARLQAKRVSSQAASKFALQRADKRFAAEQAAKEGEIREFGGNLVRVQPDGTFEIIARGTAEEADQFTLAPGQQRFDAFGNLIAGVPETPEDPLVQREKELKIQKLEGELQGNDEIGYSAQVAARTISTIDDAIALFPEVSGITGPFGRAAASKIPGTDSFDFNQKLETIRANIGFNELNAMRAASKTGGALGQVSEREIAFLQAVLGSLNIGQSDEELLSNLNKIKESIGRWNTALKEDREGGGDELDQVLDNLGFNSEEQTSLKNIKTAKVGTSNVKAQEDTLTRLEKADAAFFKATGQHIKVNQSFRTREQQQQLFNKLSSQGARVAPPGTSFHEKGLAIDVTNWKEAEKFLRQFGFKNNLQDDKGHFSIGEFA